MKDNTAKFLHLLVKPSWGIAIVLVMMFACHSVNRTAEDRYPEAHPTAGIQPRRPTNYVPYRYPYAPKELLDKYGQEMERKAKAEWADIEKVNADGPYKNTYEALAKHKCPEWFKDAKIGMFIDWGPWSVGSYSVRLKDASYPDGYELHMTDDESNFESLKEYHRKVWGADVMDDDLINLLSDRHFDPGSFARLARECGFRYVVPFLKHHGGFCLWQSSFTRRNSMDWSFHRDFALEFSKVCKKEGLRFGAYVSVGEWNYPIIGPEGRIDVAGLSGRPRPIAGLSDSFSLSGKIPVKDYARDYLIPSIKELLDKIKPDLLWYDGAWENTSNFWRTRDLNAYYYNMAELNKQEVCINDRSGSDYREKKIPVAEPDFATSEYGHGASAVERTWEECRSFSHNFGYNWTEESDPNAILSDKACIDLVVDVVGRGGNLLLIVSPTGSGELPPRQLHAIRNMGDWLNKYGKAIYGTRAYELENQPEWGRITHSKDGNTVYLLITQWPADGRINIPGIPIQDIESVRQIHGEGNPGFCKPDKNGAFMVDLSACTPGDPRVSVIEIKVAPDPIILSCEIEK